MPDFAGIPEKLTGSIQENVLTLAAHSNEYCKLVMVNVPLGLYSNKVMRELATHVYNYIHTYGKAPKEHLVDLVEDKLDDESDGEMLRQILENIHGLIQAGFNELFVVHQLSRFVRQQHLKQAIVDTIDAAEKGDVEKADDVIDAYRKTSYEQFSPGLKLKEYAHELGRNDDVEIVVPWGIPEFDRAQLGSARGEMLLFMAPPKRGKTWALLHLTKQALLARVRTAYITLEVAPKIIAGRLMQSVFSLKRREGDKAQASRFDVDSRTGRLQAILVEDAEDRNALFSKDGISKIKKSFSKSTHIARLSENLIIQGFPTGTLRTKQLIAYLENLTNFHRFFPDFVVIDMPDLMYLEAKNYRLSLSLLFKELRGLAVDRNFGLAIATQGNRQSLDVETITEKHTSEDISKIAISDVGISYNQTPAEKEMQVARLHVMVARNARDKWGVNISQAYALGQFCTGSLIVPPREWRELLPKRRRDSDEEEENGEG